MEAKELRIGNCVYVDNKEFHPSLAEKAMVICGIEKLRDDERGKIALNHINEKDNIILPAVSQFDQFIKPIKLTEEWLIKFGFEVALNGLWDVTENYSMRLEMDNYVRCSTEPISLIEIKYVHQLQNLYFALTGKELKPPKQYTQVDKPDIINEADGAR